MDNKGFISIEYLFSLFILIIIALGVLFFASSTIGSSLNIEDSVAHRLILDNLSNQISQVNSNGIGYSKYVKLPSDRGYFEITVERNKLTMEYGDRKGETLMMLADLDSKYKLVSGRTYMISKTAEGVVIS